MREKTALAVHDLSGFGRCSLTVALPILSVMGVQTTCLPTAVLSTHTGGFTGYTFRDLTQDMREYYRHYLREGFAFDAVYSGYLGSFEQIAIVGEILSAFRREDNLLLVDPVMGDGGKLYSRYTDDMARGMRALCEKADVIVPNMTEAAILTGATYRENGHDEGSLRGLCRDLRRLGAGQVVLTGVTTDEGHVGVACDDGRDFFIISERRVPTHYDGTGDVFASVLLGALLNGRDLRAAAALAVAFTHDCVEDSAGNHVNCHHGVDFEHRLWRLGRDMEKL